MTRGTPPTKNWRVLERNGKFNVVASGRRPAFLSDVYHRMLSIPWPSFFRMILLSYLLLNVFFAAAYFLCGEEALAGVRHTGVWNHFMDCFFFSVQTIATIGYGRISPVGLWPNILVTGEALTGLLVFGLLSGLLFSRFSRPTARVIFSNVALISPQDGVPCFTFRIANERLNQIVEANISVTLVKTEISKEGEQYRRIYDLKLERNHSPIFIMTWTVSHAINESSPLFGMSRDDLLKAEAELLITLTGIDDTFYQTIHSRFSYIAEDLMWGRRFTDMLSRDNGRIHVDLSQIHNTLPLLVS